MFFCNTFPYKKGKKVQNSLHRTAMNTLGEMLYLSAVALYILKSFLDTTLFYVAWPPSFEKVLHLLICITVFLKMGNWQGYSRFKWMLGILTFVIFKCSWLSTGYDFLLDTALLIIGAINTPYKKILKTGFWTGLCILSLAILGSFTNCISDLIYLDGNQLMHSFGIVYPTDFAAHITFLFLIGWVLYGETAGILPAAMALGLCLFVYHYTGSKCSTIVLFLSSALSLYVFLTEKYEDQTKVFRHLAKLIDRISVYAFLICALIMIFLTLFYSIDNYGMAQLDSLLSGRLSLGRNAIDKHGITLFGTAFAQQGYGGVTAWSWALPYTFVDCSYVLLITRYGFAVLLILCIHAIYIGRNACRHKQRHLLIAVMLIAVHSMIEHHFSEIAYNLFLLLPFAQYSIYEANKKNAPYRVGPKKYVSFTVGICVIALLMTQFPRLISYMKTIVDLCGLNAKESHIWFIIIMIGIILWFCIFILLITKIIVAIIKRSNLHWMMPLGLIMLLISLVYPFLKGNEVIQRGQDAYRELVEMDRPIIEKLLAKESNETVYIDHIPEIYKKEFDRTSDKILSAEGMATQKNITLITKDDGELRALMSAGYEYGELPSGHSVYTNSQHAKILLQELGIGLADYYSKNRSVDLNDAAKRNRLQITEDGSLLLSCSSDALMHGSGYTICKGTLQVQYLLRLISNANNELIATVGINSDRGLHTWMKEDVFLENFDENGFCSYVLECELPFDCPYVEFVLSIPDNVVLEIQSITYGKVQ